MTWRVGAVGLLAALLAGGAGGCAKGGDATDGVGASGAQGGAGGVGGVGVGGVGGDGGDGGAGAMPIPCDDPADVPCKLVAPQCGCLPGDRCMLTSQGMRVCAPDGDKQALEFCTNDCQAGFQCVNNGTTGLIGYCHQLCEADADCDTPTSGPGGICVLELQNGGATVCSQNCDPVSDTGCKEANQNLKCDIGREPMGAQRWFTRCVGSGDAAPDAVCDSINECAPGSSCIPVQNEPDSHCLTWCTSPSTGGVCPQGSSHACSAFTTPLFIGSVEYGACLPLAGF